MKTFLITGFGPFGKIEKNPSQALVAEVERRLSKEKSLRLETSILPVVYGDAVELIQSLIRDIQPVYVLSFGVAAKRESVNLERVALNLKDSAQTDNAGEAPEGEPIFTDGPLAYFTNLPLLQMREFLLNAKIPTVISNYAGAYLCNAVFYAAAYEISRSRMDARYGFVHIPLLSEDGTDEKLLSLSRLAKGVVDLVNHVNGTLAKYG